MIKVRIQGTPAEIDWFRRKLMSEEDVEVSNVSDILKNKGTIRYYRQFFYVHRNYDPTQIKKTDVNYKLPKESED